MTKNRSRLRAAGGAVAAAAHHVPLHPRAQFRLAQSRCAGQWAPPCPDPAGRDAPRARTDDAHLAEFHKNLQRVGPCLPLHRAPSPPEPDAAFPKGATEAAAEAKKGGRRGGAAATPAERAGPALRNAEMELRKCCNHPYLVDGVEDQVREERYASSSIASRVPYLSSRASAATTRTWWTGWRTRCAHGARRRARVV